MQNKQLTVVDRNDKQYVLSYLESQGETLIDTVDTVDTNESLMVDSQCNNDTNTDPASQNISNNILPQQDVYNFMDSPTISSNMTTRPDKTVTGKQKETKYNDGNR